MYYESSGYNTFKNFQNELRDKADTQRNLFGCVMGCMFSVVGVILLAGIIFNGIAISVATSFSNATCLEQATVMKLYDYVLVCSSIGIVTYIMIIVAICVIIFIIKFDNPMMLLTLTPIIIFFMLLTVYSLAMAIIGTIELAYSFQLCKHEAYSLCVMTIIIVILQFLGCTSLKFVKVKSD